MRESFLVLGAAAVLAAGCGGGGDDDAGAERAGAAARTNTASAPAPARPLKLALHATRPSVRLGRSVTLRATASGDDVPLELWSYVPGHQEDARREATATARDGRARFTVRPTRTLTYELRADHGRQRATPELVGVTVPARVSARIGSGGRVRFTLRVTVPDGADPNTKAKVYLYVVARGAPGRRAPLLGPTRLRRTGPGEARATWSSTRITPRAGDRFYACAREAWVEGYGLSDLRDTRCGLETRTNGELRPLRGV